MGKNVRELLDKQPWDDHFSRLTLYARRLLRARTWRGAPGGAAPGGREAADFALEAITDVYTGVRRWDPSTCPDLARFLFGVVRSKVSNACTAAENIRERREEPGLELPSHNSDDTFLWGFLSEIEDEPELVKVVELIMDGYADRADIAARMGLKPSDITNLQKKMRRRLREYRLSISRA